LKFLKIQNWNRISKTPKCGLYSIKNSRDFVTGKSLPPPPPLPNIPFMPIIDDIHESGVLQGFPQTIFKGVEGGSTQINQQIYKLQIFTISRYFKNCTQKRNILTTISLWRNYSIHFFLEENSKSFCL
jgi:hypothetical protein